jgi:cellulose synthase/poly-beta-1,6-N-acetylglucosamine synthase-like glycosyltransferase
MVLMVDEGTNLLSSEPIIMIPIYITLSVTYVFLIAGSVGYMVYRPKRKSYKSDNVEFVLVTVANNKVKNALRESLENLRSRFRDYLVWVVVDEGAELVDYLSEMSFSDPYLRLVVVPEEYARFRKGKARAMKYFIDYFVEPDNWYVFLDDDNIVLDDRFLYEIPYYEELGYVAFNPVLKPRKGNSVAAYVIDWIRYFNDLTLYRFFTGFLGKPLLGLHGELLGIKGHVLKELDIDLTSIAEDFSLAVELVKRGYKTWQSETTVSIKSPNSLSDLQKQRARWFKGVLRDLRRAPNLMKAIITIKSFLWIALTLVIITVVMSGYYNSFVIYLIIINSLYHWLAYMYGAYKSGKLRYFLVTPVAWLIEATSILRAPTIKDFYVIDKN